MRISDWRSDLCSSDLQPLHLAMTGSRAVVLKQSPQRQTSPIPRWTKPHNHGLTQHCKARTHPAYPDSKRPSSSKRSANYIPNRTEERRVGKRVSVSVDIGGSRIIKKKKKTTKP